MKKLTVFTPTYNRAYVLPVLYKSLINQTNKEFDWLIVDDGSTDNTRELVNGWVIENKINIKYFYQENAGKMQAHNKGVLECKTDYFICVDSDDYLKANSVEIILENLKKIETDELCGIISYKGKDESNPIGNEFPKLQYSTLSGLYEKGFLGDTSLIFKTKILREFLFPKFENEKFVPEGYIYTLIDQKYNYLVLPKIFIVCKYLSDGYTKNSLKLFNRNPIGMYNYYNLKLKCSKGLFNKIKYTIAYVCYCKVAKNKNAYKDCNNKILYILAYLFGIIFYLKRKKF